MSFYVRVFITALAVFLPVAQSQECENITVQLNINPIFDESDPKNFWLHTWANRLHISTRPQTIKNEMAFVDWCNAKQIDIQELERHLRSLRYIREAKVNIEALANDKRHATINTWDSWSLMPTLEFGRKGGKNHFALGIKDRNLLGLGVDTDFEFFTDAQRSGYKLDTQIPLYQGYNAYSNIRLLDNDDGQQVAIYLQRPFVSLHTDWSAIVGFNHEKRMDTLFNGIDSEREFYHELHQSQLSYGWRTSLYHLFDESVTQRVTVGFEQDSHWFESQDSSLRLADRDFQFAFFQLEWLQDDFREFTDVQRIGSTEDINLGWHVTSYLGYSPRNNTTPASWKLQMKANKAWQLSPNSLLITNANIHFLDSQQSPIQWSLEAQTQWYFKLSERFSAYQSSQITVARNLFADIPLTLGGDTDMRGFPTQYQHGDQRVLLNNEIRYYPKLNIWKLFELGAAAFYDLGKITGKPDLGTNYSGWLQSVGVGARLFSTHSSDRQVIHIDLAHPIGEDPLLDTFQFRVEVKHAF